MGLLDKLFRPRRDRSHDLQRLAARLESFMRPASALVDTRALTIPANRERYAVFVLGAASALAESRELGETEALALLVMFLQGAGRMQPQEVSHLVGRAMTLVDEPAGTTVREAGAQAMTRWLAGDAGSAVGRLAEVLAG